MASLSLINQPAFVAPVTRRKNTTIKSTQNPNKRVCKPLGHITDLFGSDRLVPFLATFFRAMKPKI